MELEFTNRYDGSHLPRRFGASQKDSVYRFRHYDKLRTGTWSALNAHVIG